MCKRLIFFSIVLSVSTLWSSAQFAKHEDLKNQRITGSANINYYAQYEGTPYFNEKWYRASVKLSGGEVYQDLKAELDIYKDNLVVYNAKLGRNIVVDKSIINEIYLEDEKGEEVYLIKNTSTQTTENQKEYSFYFIHVADSISLWSKQKKNLFKNNSTSADKPGYFLHQEKFYTVVDGKITSITLMKRPLAKSFPANKKTILSFIKQHHLDLKNQRHLTLLFQMINEWEVQNPSY